MQLFGSSSESIGTSKVRIKILDKSQLKIREIDSNSKIPFLNSKNQILMGTRRFKMNPIGYLGYGPIIGNSYKRNFIEPTSKFTLTFSVISNDPDDKDTLLRSLWLLTTFGGLGSRARKGFGSMCIINEDEVFKDILWFQKNRLGEVLKEFKRTEIMPYSKKFSYLCKNSKLWISKNKYPNCEECLWELGLHYYSWRSSLSVKDGRELIGFPLKNSRVDGQRVSRRASPYFLSVFKDEKEQYRYLVLLLPANFSDNLKFEGNYQKEKHMIFQKEVQKNAMEV
jgi:CRISPR-associated protein Cmr1